jgi:hypothetical protein
MDFHPDSHPPRDLIYPVNKSKYTKHLTVVLKIMLTVSVVSQPKCAICYGCSMPGLTVFNCFCYRIPLAPTLFAQRSYSRRRGQCHGAHSRDETQLELSSGGLTSASQLLHTVGGTNRPVLWGFKSSARYPATFGSTHQMSRVLRSHKHTTFLTRGRTF